MQKRVGFVGVGLMGGWLAKHLLAAGYPVTAYDIDPSKVDAIVKEGGEKTDSPDQIAPRVDVLILSLPDSSVVNEVVRHNLRLFETGRKGLIVIDCSTADPAMSEILAAELGEKGIEMLDATISGTSEMCAAKDTIFMVGGNKDVYAQCVPLFAAMGRESVHMGDSGKGAAIKLVVNLVLSLNRMALAEGLTLAKKAGLDRGRRWKSSGNQRHSPKRWTRKATAWSRKDSTRRPDTCRRITRTCGSCWRWAPASIVRCRSSV